MMFNLFRKKKTFWDTLQKSKSAKVEAVNYKAVWKKQPHISKEDFDSIPTNERVEVLYDLASFFIFNDDGQNDAEKFASFPDMLKTVYSVMSFIADVNCDGFSGYFTNSHGFLAFDTLAALTQIGATETRGILQTALNTINLDGKDDRALQTAIANEEIEELYESDELDEKLHELDNRFYSLEENAAELLAAFVSHHFTGV